MQINQIKARDDFEGDLVLVMEDENVHCLNKTAKEIFLLVEKGLLKADIVRVFADKYTDIERDEIIRDIDEIIQNFKDVNLIAE